jgi:hypothetical protein
MNRNVRKFEFKGEKRGGRWIWILFKSLYAEKKPLYTEKIDWKDKLYVYIEVFEE